MVDRRVAGIGGTCAAVGSTESFLSRKAGEEVEFPKNADLPSLCAENAEAFIKEVCRLDPPVTSAISVLKEPLSFTYPNGTFSVGKPFERTFEEGALCQYTISIANRDPTVFKDPTLFNPMRANLEKSLSWNGAWSAGTHWSASA